MLFSVNVFATKENFKTIIPALEKMNFNVSDACFTSVEGQSVMSAMCTSDLTNIQIVAALDSCSEDNGLTIHSLLTSEGFDGVSSGYKVFSTDNSKPVDINLFITPYQAKKQNIFWHLIEEVFNVSITEDLM